MRSIFPVIAVIAAPILVFLINWLLKKVLPAEPTKRHFIAVIISIFVLAIGIDRSSRLSIEPPQPTPKATPVEISGKATFFDSLQEYKYFPVGNDQDGQSWYGDGGYTVLSKDSKSGWIWVMPEKNFSEMILEVEAIPISDGRVTGYVIAVGWNDHNYHEFTVQPDGDCGFIKVKSHILQGDAKSKCPKLVQNQSTVTRLEIEKIDGNKYCMLAFVDGKFAAEECFNDYDGGLLGLGAYNGGAKGSGVEAIVRFNDLVVWDYPG